MNRHSVRVYFEDTDFTGRVYHGAFVRFFERGRTELLRAAGIDHMALASSKPPVYFTLRSMALEFRAPAFIDDLLVVESMPQGVGGARFKILQTIFRDEKAIANADVELCLIDDTGRPVRPNVAIAAALRPG
ncbi:MAG: YbgC/FadM family acyl-CoA thioesterase [Pseudomonadota bacterium]